ncbi:MAG TPA: AMP-binding protein, partial [Acidimicrobiales bacterium]
MLDPTCPERLIVMDVTTLEATVADLVEAQVARTPEAIAVVAGGASLSYAELDAAANRLARHLQDRRVGTGVAVGVCAPRGLDLAVGLLGVLKAGGAVLALDATHPPERLRFMLADSGAPVVVGAAALMQDLGTGDVDVVRLDADAAAWAALEPTPPPRAVGPDHLAYVVYTSGS